jgi:hypothetical protein
VAVEPLFGTSLVTRDLYAFSYQGGHNPFSPLDLFLSYSDDHRTLQTSPQSGFPYMKDHQNELNNNSIHIES